MSDDVRTPAASDVIMPLGHDVYQIDTRMAGYQGITAGYLIRSSRPCLVETGTSTSAPVSNSSRELKTRAPVSVEAASRLAEVAEQIAVSSQSGVDAMACA